MTPLATVTELAAFLHTTLSMDDATAIIYLENASGMVRDYLQQEITLSVDDVVVVDPLRATYAFLPELPIGSVSKVETLSEGVWSVADPATYMVSTRTGVIEARPYLGVDWPFESGSWRVTYTHGYAEIPDGIRGVVLGVAARGYATESGVDMERIGGYSGYQVTYSKADGFTDLEMKTLNRYRVARIS